MRCRYLVICLLGACASHLRTEVVGNGTVTVQARTEASESSADMAVSQAPAPVAGGVQLTRGIYDLQLHFDVARAQKIEWTVTCPGFERRGTDGETFEAYRTRRIAQLQRQREAERTRMAEAQAKASANANVNAPDYG